MDDNKEKEKTTLTWKRSHVILLLGLAIMFFLANVCFSLQAPFFPTEAGKKGVSTTVIGFIFGTYELSKFITSPLWGNMISKIGVKFLFLSGVVVCGSCAVLFGVLDKGPDGTSFIVLCLLCRSLEGVGTAAFMTAGYAIVAHEFKERTAIVYGTLQTFIGFGNMVGPPLGGTLYAVGGYGLPFYVIGGTTILVGLLCCFVLPPVIDPGNQNDNSVLKMLRNPLTLVFCLSIVAGSFSLGFLDPTLAVHLSKFDIGSVEIGFIFLVLPGVYALAAPMFGWLCDKKGLANSLVIFGNLGMAIVFITIGPAPFLEFIPFELWSQILTLVIAGFFLCSSLCPNFKGLLKSASQIGLPDDVNTHGIVSGISVSCFALGAFLGPILGGTLVDNFQFPWAACFCSVLFLLSAIVMSSYTMYSKVRSKMKYSAYAKCNGFIDNDKSNEDTVLL